MAGPLRRGVGMGWQFRPGMGASRPLPYETMTIDEIASVPVPDFAEDNAALYLWTINAYVEAAYSVARYWGFKPSTLLTWCKNPMGGGLGGAFGITSEYILYARRGSPPERKHTGTWFAWTRRYINGKPSHSTKPEAFFDLVEQVNDGPYLELFSRNHHRLGWDVHGFESANTGQLEAAP